ncbi:MAG TPA: 4'-phosphopantetheinyl transferase superfamily protein [Acidimicrobiia bacterium]|nr:4'-phosphopantetheinyl transferase superfamily protein [Acidimicrobiia bacterium]
MTSADVRVISLDLDQPAAVVERLDALLPPSERDAPVPIRVARATTRVVLAEVLGIDPLAVPISRRCAHCGHPTHGRPTVAGAGGLSYSLSHSGSFAILALADGDARVGVDVEQVQPRRRLGALAARVLNDEEHADWLAIDDADDQLRSFLRAWTAKEAYLKALGIGIATRLRDVPVRVEGWTATELRVGGARIASLAIDRTDFGVRYLESPALAMSNGGTAG